MKSLNKLFQEKFIEKKISNYLVLIFIVFLSFLGFVDATYIAVNSYFEKSLPCTILGGCDKVLSSVYSQFLGISLAVWGALYYMILFLISFSVLIDVKFLRRVKFVFWISLLGVLVSLILLYLQIFVLDALCFYCILSALFTTLIFIFSLFFMKRNYEF